MKIVLSISGGGIRGLIPAIILQEIEKRTDMRISECCDLISGNSTGGIISCLLTTPNIKNRPKYSAGQIVNMYKEFGREVFKRNIARIIFSFGGLIANKYSYKPLEKLLKDYFQITRLSDATTNLLIPSYQISNTPFPHFFKSTHAKASYSKEKNPFLWQCARSTSAASSYFRPYKFNNELTFIDGGLFANNPSMCAYSQAKKMWGDEEKIVLISLGTGECLQGYPYNKIKHWGIVQWAIPYFQQTSISADSTVDYMMKTFANSNSDDLYYRLQPLLDKQFLKMDDASAKNMSMLENCAKQLIEENTDMINEICEIFKNSKKSKE